MNYQLYCVYDKIAEQYGAPFCSLNDATATRSFNQQINSNPMSEPTDFELYCVGLFDTDNGSIVPNIPLRFVTKGKVITNV